MFNAYDRQRMHASQQSAGITLLISDFSFLLFYQKLINGSVSLPSDCSQHQQTAVN